MANTYTYTVFRYAVLWIQNDLFRIQVPVRPYLGVEGGDQAGRMIVHELDQHGQNIPQIVVLNNKEEVGKMLNRWQCVYPV